MMQETGSRESMSLLIDEIGKMTYELDQRLSSVLNRIEPRPSPATIGMEAKLGALNVANPSLNDSLRSIRAKLHSCLSAASSIQQDTGAKDGADQRIR